MLPSLSKGKEVKIPLLGQGYLHGNVTEARDTCAYPRESYLFFLTAGCVTADGRGISLSGEAAPRLAKHPNIRGVGCVGNRP